MRKDAIIFCCFIGVALLSACGPIKMPNVTTYSLSSTASPYVPKTTRTNLTLGVGIPTAAAGYQNAEMIYIKTPYEHSSFALHKWAAPPAEMLNSIIVQALRAKGYFKAVVASPYSVKTNYRLDFQLLQLEQNFTLPVSMEVLTIQVNVFNNKTNRVVASQRFSTKISAKRNTPYSGVVAANQAVTKLSREIANFTVRVIYTSHGR